MRSHLQKMHDSIKTWKKYTRQNQYNAKTSCEPAQNHGIKQKVKRLMLSDLYSSLLPCGAHSQNGQGQPSETRVPWSQAFCALWTCSRYWMLLGGLWLWCSTRCCLIFLLADAYDMESASPLKRMLYSFTCF